MLGIPFPNINLNGPRNIVLRLMISSRIEPGHGKSSNCYLWISAKKKYFLERKTVHDLDASLSETLDVFFLQLGREHLVDNWVVNIWLCLKIYCEIYPNQLAKLNPLPSGSLR
jgi:hypothetical protein